MLQKCFEVEDNCCWVLGSRDMLKWGFMQKACHCDCMLQIILDWSVFDANDPKGWRHVVKGFMAEDMFLGYFVSNTCVFTQLGEKTMHNVM